MKGDVSVRVRSSKMFIRFHPFSDVSYSWCTCSFTFVYMKSSSIEQNRMNSISQIKHKCTRTIVIDIKVISTVLFWMYLPLNVSTVCDVCYPNRRCNYRYNKETNRTHSPRVSIIHWYCHCRINIVTITSSSYSSIGIFTFSHEQICLTNSHVYIEFC
jgi:hypothetical protein